jgi:hypothetical protein
MITIFRVIAVGSTMIGTKLGKVVFFFFSLYHLSNNIRHTFDYRHD